jgi:tryptophanyl-tRNA synthetase
MYGYGSVKKRLADVYWEYFANARKKRAEFAADLDYVNGVLAEGATKARTLAQKVLHRARKASGLE